MVREHIFFLGSAIIPGEFHISYHNKGKSKPFHRVSQGFLNLKLLQSPAVDRTVSSNGLYSLQQWTVRSATGDCNNSTDRQA